MYTKNGSILLNAYSVSSLTGFVPSDGSTPPSVPSTGVIPYLSFVGSSTTNSNFIFISSTSGSLASNKVGYSVGYRSGELTEDTYAPVLNTSLAGSITTVDNISTFVIRNSGTESVTINEVDFLCTSTSSYTPSTLFLVCAFALNEITLEPDDSISFAILH